MRFDDVDAGYFLGDSVFDLDAWIDFDEVKLVRVGIDQELNGAGVLIADFFADRNGRIAEGVPDFGKQIGGRCDLDNLLVAPLH